ncbi:SNF2-related protein [Thermodesulfatator indicus]
MEKLKQISIFERVEERVWPSVEFFPLNTPYQKIENIVREDILSSSRYTIVTGYSSLEYLISFFGEGHFPNRKITVVLGHELDLPEEQLKAPWPKVNLSQEIKEYWLEKGISVTLSGALLNFLEELKARNIVFRLGRELHAKVYLGDTHAILGSSNFSRAGLVFQKEANIRLSATDPRYEDLKLIVSNFVKDSQDYQEEIIALLEQLLRYVSWQEVLAYAICQIMGDEWLTQHEGLSRVLARLKLWPSQRQAVAQALWVLDNHGSVLIADPTGAGKTKVGLAVLTALSFRFLSRQELRRLSSYVICPPGVKDQWEEEALSEDIPFVPEAISQGLLSVSHGEARSRALEKIRRANILLIDEAHNYLSRTSRRSQSIQLNSLAEHVILMTATPINRGVEDLLRLMEVLGLDNLSEEGLETYQKLRREIETTGKFSRDQLEKLRRYVQLFTVRRTKQELNRLIEEKPEEYRDKFGRLCRFPKEISKLYPTGETQRDRELALKIDELSRELKGLVWLRKTIFDLWQNENAFDANFLSKRLSAAPALARFNVKAMLRSSRVALVEHIEGTEAAQRAFGLSGKFKHATGDILSALADWKLKAKELFRPLPETAEAPLWLKSKEAFLEALDQEMKIYGRIASLCREISPAREETKARFVLELFKKHKLILAYDSRLITLAYLEGLVKRLDPEIKILFVTGGRPKERRLLKRFFSLGSPAKNVLALCSDAVAEGVNLQQAGAVVFFDLPSVIRLAEQRIGRIERLDSPHEEVEIYWPNDSQEFCVSTDRRLVERHLLVENILGSNINIPEEFLEYAQGYQEEKITGRMMLELFEQKRKEFEASFWDGLADAFQPVKKLMEGENPLVPEKTFREIKGLKIKGSLVSAVKAKRPWCFLCLKGSKKANTAPSWVFLEKGKEPITDISEICQKLRENLTPDEASIPWLKGADELLQSFLEDLKRAEFLLLPARHKRALKVFQEILRYYHRRDRGHERRAVVARLLYLIENYREENLDLYHFSRLCLELLVPKLQEFIKTTQKRGPFLLKDLKTYLRENPLTTEELKSLLANVKTKDPVEKMIAACLLGLPEESKE